MANFGLAVARADGKVANAERDTIRKHLQQSFGHDAELARWINPLMDAAERNAPILEQCLTEMQSLFDAGERQGLYRLACDIVDASGRRNAKKKACLETLASKWGIAETPIVPVAPAPLPAVPNAKAEGALGRDDCLKALEIAVGTPITADLIRRQYRLLSEKIDPTRLESHGAEFVQLATEKRARIDKAARFLLGELGEAFEVEKKPEEPKNLRHNPDLDAVFGM